MEKDLRKNYAKKLREVKISLNKGIKEKNPYTETINQSKLNVLTKLDGYSSYIYFATLINTNISAYRTELISKIDDDIKAKYSAIKELSLVINNYRDELKSLSKADIKRKKEIKIIISCYENKIRELKNEIRELGLVKKETVSSSDEELKNSFREKYSEDCNNYRNMLQEVITPTDRIIYDLVRTKEGYFYLNSKIYEIEELKKRKNDIRVSSFIGLDFPESFDSYLEKNLGITNYTINANKKELGIIRDKITETLLLLKLLNQILKDFNIERLESIKRENSNEKYGNISAAGTILISFNFELLDESMNIEYRKLMKFLNFPNQEYTNSLFDSIWEAYTNYNYSLDLLEKCNRIKFIFSKVEKMRVANILEELDKRSTFIVSRVKSYIEMLNQSIKLRFGSNDGLDKFTLGLESLLSKINGQIHSIDTQKESIEAAIAKTSLEIAQKSGIRTDTEIDWSSVDIMSSFEKVYAEQTIQELEHEVYSSFEHTPTGYTYQKKPNN